ncbi:hypothetical protein GCM10010303_16960 [Streptomyces purpurascens]|nr:hypothetical protein GCM10010303_16960 [Streptomyces purpurascens]
MWRTPFACRLASEEEPRDLGGAVRASGTVGASRTGYDGTGSAVSGSSVPSGSRGGSLSCSRT